MLHLTDVDRWSGDNYNQCRDGIAVIDANGMICYSNAAWKKILPVSSLSPGNVVHSEGIQVGNSYLAVLEVMFGPEHDTFQSIAQEIQQVLYGDRHYAEQVCSIVLHGQEMHCLVQMHAYPVRGGRGVLLQQRILPLE